MFQEKVLSNVLQRGTGLMGYDDDSFRVFCSLLLTLALACFPLTLRKGWAASWLFVNFEVGMQAKESVFDYLGLPNNI